MAFLDFEELEDRVTLLLTSAKNKNTLHFYHLQGEIKNPVHLPRDEELEVSVHIHQGDPDHYAHSLIVIENSQYHHKLFDSIKRHVLQSGKVSDHNGVCFYAGLTMQILNALVKQLHFLESKDPVVLKIRKDLGENYVVPEKFTAFRLMYSPVCLSLVHPAVIRCFSICREAGGRSKISCSFRCFATTRTLDKFQNTVPAFVRPSQPRNYESRAFHDHASPWPLLMSKNQYPESLPFEKELAERMRQWGAVVMPLNSDPFVSEFLPTWIRHLFRIMKITEVEGSNLVALLMDTVAQTPVPAENFRYPNLKQSVHVPAVHGKTLYGHFLHSNLKLFKCVEPIVVAAFRANVATADKLFVVGTASLSVQI
jgi:hypothetical protein